MPTLSQFTFLHPDQAKRTTYDDLELDEYINYGADRVVIKDLERVDRFLFERIGETFPRDIGRCRVYKGIENVQQRRDSCSL